MKNQAAIIFILVLFSCRQLPQHTNEITKIELSRSGAWSDYGATIIIDSALNYRYFDENKKQGYIGRIDEKFFDTLNRKFESIKFKTMPDRLHLNCEDCNIFELIVHWGNNKRRIMMGWPIIADSTFDVLLWVNDSYKRVVLLPTKTVFHFETYFPNENIKIPLDSVKFPPPLPKPFKKRQHKISTE